MPDGGPKGNWMGIRPVHCREAVAFFLNFTYMIDMPEHERILRENQDKLYGNGGVDDKVLVETVLSQMRREYPEVYACAKKVVEYFASTWDWQCNDEELLYLILHIYRVQQKND